MDVTGAATCQNCGTQWGTSNQIDELTLCPDCADGAITADQLGLSGDVPTGSLDYEVETPDETGDPVLDWAEFTLPDYLGSFEVQRAGDRLDIEIDPPVSIQTLDQIRDELKASRIDIDHSAAHANRLVLCLAPQLSADEARERIDEVTPDPSPASQCDAVASRQEGQPSLYATEDPPFGNPDDTPDALQPDAPDAADLVGPRGPDEAHYSEWQATDGAWQRVAVYRCDYAAETDTIDVTQTLPSA